MTQKTHTSSSEEKLEEIKLTFYIGISYFLDYAKVHFHASHYQSILKDIREINFTSHNEWVISKELLDSMYLVAKKSLEEKKFIPAYDLFYLLSLILPNNFDVWIGLGIACQQTNQNLKAVQAFECAKQLIPTSIFPYLYAAESYFELHDWETSQKNCDQGLVYAEQKQKIFVEALQILKNKCHNNIKAGVR